jgi:hypothetical protein
MSSVDELKLKDEHEIVKLIVDGKVKLNNIIKAVAESIVSIPANSDREYRRVKEVRAPRGQTLLEKKEYARSYYKKNKDKFKEKYQKNRDILNENGKKYYQLRKLKKLAPSTSDPRNQEGQRSSGTEGAEQQS